MVEYDRADDDSATRTYEWLEKEMEAAVDRIRRKSNFRERESGLLDIGRQSQPKKQQAAPAKEEPQQRGRSEQRESKNPKGSALAAPAKKKNDKDKKEGRGRSKSRGDNQPAAPAGDASRDRSQYHCYWFHHKDGCNRGDECKFKRDEDSGRREEGFAGSQA